jgi:hypothetical protein
VTFFYHDLSNSQLKEPCLESSNETVCGIFHAIF